MPRKFIEKLIIGIIPLVVPIVGVAETIECHGRKALQIEGPLGAKEVAVKNDKYFDDLILEILGDDVRYTESGMRGKTVYLAKIAGKSEDGQILKISINTIVAENGKTHHYSSEVVAYLIVDLKGRRVQRFEVIPFRASFYTESSDCKVK